MKLFALALVAWAVLGSVASGLLAALILSCLLILVALLDAAQVMTPGAGRETPLNDADIGALVRRLFSVAVGPYYLVLIVLACAGVAGRGDLEKGRGGDFQTIRQGDRESHQTQKGETTMCGGHGCGSAGGCGTSGCGASSGGTCGCGGAKKATAPKPKPVIATPEAKARAEAMQQRTMMNLPGIGPNAKPLPPGLTPNPNAVLPPSAQKLLDAAKAAPSTPPPAPSSTAAPVPSPSAPPNPPPAAPAT